MPDEDVWIFYRALSNLVRQHAGEQALRSALAQDEDYMRRIAAGHPRTPIIAEARQFFYELMTLGNDRPEHFTDEDWVQLKLIRDQWM